MLFRSFIEDLGGNNGVTGEAGNDVIQVFSDPGNHSLVIGGSGNDFLGTVGGNNTLRGEADNDILSVNENVSSLDGGAGSDTCFGGATETNCNP